MRPYLKAEPWLTSGPERLCSNGRLCAQRPRAITSQVCESFDLLYTGVDAPGASGTFRAVVQELRADWKFHQDFGGQTGINPLKGRIILVIKILCPIRL